MTEGKRERRPTQVQQILALLIERPEGITPGDALNEIGCFRLAARINDLKRMGHNIRTERYTTPRGASVAKYVLEVPPKVRTIEAQPVVSFIQTEMLWGDTPPEPEGRAM